LVWPTAFPVIAGKKTLDKNMKHVKLRNRTPKMELRWTRNPELLIPFLIPLFTMIKQFKYKLIFDGTAKDKSTYAVLIGNPARD
jgi:hypothetical protein